MIKWFFRWWYERIKRAAEEENAVHHAAAQIAGQTHFEGGINFQLVEAENGKILRVQIPVDPNTVSSAMSTTRRRHIGGMGGFGGAEEKLYVIAEDENVMDFITRALVEERIK